MLRASRSAARRFLIGRSTHGKIPAEDRTPVRPPPPNYLDEFSTYNPSGPYLNAPSSLPAPTSPFALHEDNSHVSSSSGQAVVGSDYVAWHCSLSYQLSFNASKIYLSIFISMTVQRQRISRPVRIAQCVISLPKCQNIPTLMLCIENNVNIMCSRPNRTPFSHCKNTCPRQCSPESVRFLGPCGRWRSINVVLDERLDVERRCPSSTADRRLAL